MIKLRDLSMTYSLEREEVPVLRDVNIDIGQGESVAIVGPSGSGKTTLLLLLAGLEAPTAGRIELQDVDIAGLGPDELADLRRDRLGIIFQSFHLIPSLTALGNVALPLEIAGDAEAADKADAMLQRVGLGHREQHYPSQLSGGEQQRVAIARALVHGPPLVLADEPTGNLDKRTGVTVSDLLFELHDNLGSTLIVVTHDERMASRCDRQLQLDEGRLMERRRRAMDGRRIAEGVPRMRFLVKLAWQDLSASGHALWVFCACLALGVTLVAATGGLYRQVSDALLTDTRELTGGDLEVDARSPLPAEVLAWMSSTGDVSLLVELDTMMGTAAGFQLVELQSVDDNYPLYGELKLQPGCRR